MIISSNIIAMIYALSMFIMRLWTIITSPSIIIAMFYLPNDLNEPALSKACAALAVSGAVDEGGDASER